MLSEAIQHYRTDKRDLIQSLLGEIGVHSRER